MNNIQFIYFDVGGVLLDWSNVFQTAASKFNRTVKDIDTVFEKHHDQITKGQMTSREFWQECIKNYGLKHADDFDFVGSWVSDYQPIKPMHELVRKIKVNYKVGLLSNIYESMLPLLLEKEIIPRIEYDSIVFSCDVGMKKPHNDIYEYAHKKAGIDADKILFIDDRADYLEPAKKIGWQTFLFNSGNINNSVRLLKEKLL